MLKPPQQQLLIQAGADYWVQFVYTDGNGNGIELTSPRLEMRSAASTLGGVVYSSETSPATITFTQPSAGTVIAAIAAATTANITAPQLLYWDCYGVDPNGKTVLLGTGTATVVPNVSRF